MVVNMINDMGIEVFDSVLDFDLFFLKMVNIDDEEVVEEVEVVLIIVVESEFGCIIDLVCMYMWEMGIVDFLIW